MGRRGGGGGQWTDHYTERAHKQGYAARSVYKLEEIDQRWSVLRRGQRVFDMGCAPGSWTQYAAQKVGTEGKVIGCDLQAVSASLPSQVTVWQQDVWELDLDTLKASFDIVLSDMAPATSGDHGVDALRSEALVERALDVASEILCVGGHAIFKVLEGGGVPALVARMRIEYETVKRFRPQATRKSSSEIFLIGLNKR